MTEELVTNEEKQPAISAVPKKKVTRRRSGGHKRPVRKAIAPEGERPVRSKPTRVKFADRNRIAFDHLDPDYVYRVVSDKVGRIEKMQSIGYDFVESDEQLGDYKVADGSKFGKAVSKPVGGGTTGYLMRIPKEFYDEDQTEKAKRVDATEVALKPQKAKEEYGPGLTKD